jgi:hypothetical protein
MNSEQLDWFAHGRVIFNDSKGAHHVDQEKMWPVGIIAENWSLGIRNSFHPNSLTIKANALRQVGGWPEDLEVNEDQALMLFLNNRFVGKQLPIQIIRYRVWDKQTIADKNYLNKKKAAFKLIEQQLNQRRIEAGFKPIKAPPARPSPYKK